MTNKEIVIRWVNSTVENGFLCGWGGDRTQSFKDEQVQYMLGIIDGKIEIGRHRLISMLYDCAFNLKKYCSYTDDDVNQIIYMFGFSNIRQVNELYGKPPDYLKKVIHDNKYIGEKSYA